MSTATRATATAPTITGTAAYAPLLLRLAAGGLMLLHGLPKLGGIAGVQGMVAGMGVPAPGLVTWLVVGGEIGLGVLLLAGLLTRVAGALLAVQMALYVVLVHAPQGLLTPSGLNGEHAVLLGVIGAALALTGAGGASLDRARGRA
ncbi:putative oxidoreductase [Kineococcus xinjiangensis]|uniref:Putative oxidoreductase n=1 Tax=Kineococcus xinjiangensis TaxID=512762 RepID=A0A2S6IWA9_9ACTN|nr:DoxX family protein [Kineococcus xinjiangensis]PPK98644.1 putative oxidoreductase [Kineococcus xinjiangensis]